MICPHCDHAFDGPKNRYLSVINRAEYRDASQEMLATLLVPGTWHSEFYLCPDCGRPTIFLEEAVTLNAVTSNTRGIRVQAYPPGSVRRVPSEVPERLRRDFAEAAAVLPFSPNASAALSRRCLQAIIRQQAKIERKNLSQEIDALIATNTLPPFIADELHLLREMGNLAAHPMMSGLTGEILDVEPREAESSLDVIESLFEFYFVAPGRAAARRESANRKLRAAGKAPLK